MSFGELRERLAIVVHTLTRRMLRRRVPRSAALKWERSESKVSRRYEAVLGEYLDIGDHVEELAFDCLSRVVLAQPDEGVLHAHNALLARVLNDLRCTSLMALRGYTMQSWTVASACFEVAYAMGFIGNDVERAKRWLAHSDLSRPPWDVKAALDNTAIYLDLAKTPRHRKEWIDREYRLYERLCIGKHANPASERLRYLGQRKEKVILRLTPYFSEARATEAKLGMMLATRSATMACWVYWKTHTPEAKDLGDRLVQLTSGAHDLMADQFGS